MVRRVYSEVANSYAPFRQAVLQGLGGGTPLAVPGGKLTKDGWPVGRSYVGTAHFRAPYDEFSYFQDNTLQGLGAMNQQNYAPTLGAVRDLIDAYRPALLIGDTLKLGGLSCLIVEATDNTVTVIGPTGESYRVEQVNP